LIIISTDFVIDNQIDTMVRIYLWSLSFFRMKNVDVLGQ
jgi:hypothetical protein